MAFYPPDALLWTLMFAGLCIGIVAICFGAFFGYMMRINATEKADLATRMFAPWWPWMDGMLTAEGLRYRKPWLISVLVFLVGLALVGLAVLRGILLT
jgi:hypothetical protein